VSEPALVSAEGLHTYYGPSHVLHGVDFEVRRGETVALMGRNGMGKTTLLRSLMGLSPPKRGRIMIEGRDVTGAAPHAVARAGLALVPEGRGIFPSLTVREHLVMAARPGRDGRAEWTLARVLETFPHLAERLDHGGAQLSGGEQQMLTIGRALMTNPELLILDEATEGLAPLIAREIWSILRRLRAGGMAAVIVDKNSAAMTAIADRCVILVKGSAIFAGTAAALRAAPEILQKHLGV
jgi:branched-chain amino acid transport system ATP-binding protein